MRSSAIAKGTDMVQVPTKQKIWCGLVLVFLLAGCMPLRTRAIGSPAVGEPAQHNAAQSIQPAHQTGSPARPRAQSPVNGGSAPVKAVAYETIPNVPGQIRVCAWVNGTPIFTSELEYLSAPRLWQYRNAAKSVYLAERKKVYQMVLKKLIEDEVVYQDAYQKLKDNPTMLKKIQEFANKKFEQSITQFLAKNKVNRQEFERQLQAQGSSLDAQRRKAERDIIVNEYLRSRVSPYRNKIGHAEIRQYYEQHRAEFQTADEVDWEDIFIEAGSQEHPTMADARLFGQQLAARLEAGTPIATLLPHDDGDAAARQGKGSGKQQGEIKPAVLEKHLFNMKNGEIRLVQISTGIHVFRLVRRQYAGQMAFDKDVQDRIRTKLSNELLNQEFRRIIRQLVARAIIEVDEDALK